MPTKFVPFEYLMKPDEYVRHLDAVDTTSGDFARFLGSDRSTGYRWKTRYGPPNGGARLLQLMVALGLTMAMVKDIIDNQRRGVVVLKSAKEEPHAEAEVQTG